MMKKLIQISSWCFALAGAVSIHATTYPQGDLLIGFSKQSGFDLVYDLGAATSLVDGKTWNLNAGTLLTTNYTLSTVNWGVIGDVRTTSDNWTTTDGTQAATVGNSTQRNALNSAIGALYQYFPATGAGQYLLTDHAVITDTPELTWDGQTIVGVGTTYVGQYENPNVVGLSTASFWHQTGLGNTPVLIGTFTLNASGVLTYHVASAPASSTNAYLTSLTLSPAGTLSPAFTSNVMSYATSEAYGSVPTVTAVNADSTATNRLIYNGTTNLLASGVASSGLSLTLGVTNVVRVQVTAQDGVTVNTYTVNIIKQPSQTQPTLTNSVAGGNLVLSWPADHLGYRLLVQTNNLSKGVSLNTNDWAMVAGSPLVTTTNLPIVKTNVGGYYRLVYP